MIVLRKKRIYNKNFFRICLISLFLIILIFFSISPKFTGYVTAGREIKYTDDLNLRIDEDSEYNWSPGNSGILKSVRLSGSLTGSGSAKIYLEYDNKQYLIFSSLQPEKNLPSITGMAVINETGINASINQTNETQLNQSINRTSDKPLKNISINKTITINLGYKEGTQWDSDDNGIEPITGIIDFTVENTSFNWQVNKSKLCTKWKTHSIDNQKTTAVCYGNTDCCAFINIDQIKDNWNDVFYSNYSKHGVTFNNIISSQVIYYDVSLEPDDIYSKIYYSDLVSLSAVFENITRFSNACLQTCSIYASGEDKYKLIFEIENAALHLDNITYTVKEKTKQKENTTLHIDNITYTVKEKTKQNMTAVNIEDKQGNPIGSYEITAREDGKFDLEIRNKRKGLMSATATAKSKIKINKIEKLKTIKVFIDSSSDERIKTKVVAINESLEFDSAEITLEKEGDINAIMYCSDFDFDEFNCDEWEKTDIPFVDDGDTITFSVSHFSAYAGANITILNVQSYPVVGGNWTVMFNTTDVGNLTITANNGTTWSNVNEDNDLKFLEVKCGNETLGYEWIDEDSSVFIADYSCNETGSETSKVLTTGVHTLRFEFGEEVAYAYNDASHAPNIDFVIPTPANGTTTTNTSVEINISITNASDLAEFKWNWNGTNYTFYNDSLVLMFNFDNVSAIGENATKAVDVSKYGNNGTIHGAGWNSSGKFGDSLSFDGVDNVIALTEFSLTSDFTISFWSKIDELTGSNPVLGKGEFVSSYLLYDGASNRWKLELDTTGTIYQMIEASSNDWEYIVITKDDDYIAYHKNGVAKTPTVLSDADNFTIGYIGKGYGGSYFNGLIDEVRIWNKSLSAVEIYEHYVSNLKKYDADKWEFYINQSKNATDGLTDGNYNYYGYAKDNAGNENSTETRTITVDTTPPKITVVSPTATTYTTLSIDFNVSANENLSSCKFTINNWATNTTMTQLNLTYYYNTSSVSEGSYTAKFWCNDTVGNINNSEQVSFSVDTTAPGIKFTYPTPVNNTISSTSAEINISLTESALDNFIFNWNSTNYTFYDDSLVLMMNFDNVSALGENATKAVDVSKYGNNGTFKGSGEPAWISSGKYGNALEFDGVDDYVDFSSITLDRNNASFECWFNVKQSPVGMYSDKAVLVGYDSKFQRYIGYDVLAGKYRIIAESNTNEDIWAASNIPDFSLGVWYHLALSADSGTVKTYVNGDLLGTHTPSYNMTIDKIGGCPNANNSWVNGAIDEVRIYNRALSGDEILMHYQSEFQKYNSTQYGFYSNPSNMPCACELSETFGHTANPTGNPIGGGSGYSNIITPGQADYYVNNRSDLISALASATSGEIIYINDSIEINLTAYNLNEIAGGVTLASGRGNGSSNGALLYSNNITDQGLKPMYHMFKVAGENVRFTGLRLKGPDNETNYGGSTDPYNYSNSRGIDTDYKIEVDNCEITGWSHCGVCISYNSIDKEDSHIHHNYIHHNQRDRLGYGVSLHCSRSDGNNYSSALIEANLFDYNRHSVEGAGCNHHSYEARYNHVLEHAINHAFDMHGGVDRKDGTDIAGGTIRIHHNTFELTSHDAVRIRGVPTEGCWVYKNYLNTSNRDSIEQINAFGNFSVYDNCWDGICNSIEVDGTYTYSASAKDIGGKENSTETRTLTVDTTGSTCNYNGICESGETCSSCPSDCGACPSLSSGGGGSGSAPVVKVYSIPFTEQGTEKELKKDESAKIIFDGAYHKIKVAEIGKDYADIEVSSDTISFRLYVGENKKINLEGDNYYDLYIELKEIVGSKAKLIIKKMNEQILPTVPAITLHVEEEVVVPEEIPEKVEIKEEVEKPAPSRLSRIKDKLSLIKNILKAPSKVYVFALIVVAVSALIIFSLKAIKSRNPPPDVAYPESMLYNPIKKALKKGFDKKRIREVAIHAGWKKETVDKVFRQRNQK